MTHRTASAGVIGAGLLFATAVACSDGPRAVDASPRVDLSFIEFPLASAAHGDLEFEPEGPTGVRTLTTNLGDTCGAVVDDSGSAPGVSGLIVDVYGSPGESCAIVGRGLTHPPTGCAARVILFREFDGTRRFRLAADSGTVRAVPGVGGTLRWEVDAGFLSDPLATLVCDSGGGPDGELEVSCTCLAPDGAVSECEGRTEETCCNAGRAGAERLVLRFESSACDAACACLASVPVCGCPVVDPGGRNLST